MTSESDSESSMSAKPISAAVLSRSRRSTAGKRMSNLVGKARDDDDSFWGHSTWKEDIDKDTKKKKDADDEEDSDIVSSDGSYNVEEEEEENRVDKFDSDFNDSEDDSDADTAATPSESHSKRKKDDYDLEPKKKKNRYVDPTTKKKLLKQNQHYRLTAGRELLKRKKGSRKGSTRRKVGEGTDENAGLVLHVQPVFTNEDGIIVPICPDIYKNRVTRQRSMSKEDSNNMKNDAAAKIESSIDNLPVNPIPTIDSAISTDTATATPKQAQTTQLSEATTAEHPQPPERQQLPRSAQAHAAPISTPTASTSSATPAKATVKTFEKRHQPRLGRTVPSPATPSNTTNTSNSSNTTNKQKRKKYTQEELLLEAARKTEGENERWLLQRKRVQSQSQYSNLTSKGKHFQFYQQNQSKVLQQRQHSRRGCYTTITFFDMDCVPEMLTKRKVLPKIEKNENQTRNEGDKIKVCVITGKLGRYKDPKTGKRYFDLMAFKELRRRLAAGEPLEGNDSAIKNRDDDTKEKASIKLQHAKSKTSSRSTRVKSVSNTVSDPDVAISDVKMHAEPTSSNSETKVLPPFTKEFTKTSTITKHTSSLQSNKNPSTILLKPVEAKVVSTRNTKNIAKEAAKKTTIESSKPRTRSNSRDVSKKTPEIPTRVSSRRNAPVKELPSKDISVKASTSINPSTLTNAIPSKKRKGSDIAKPLTSTLKKIKAEDLRQSLTKAPDSTLLPSKAPITNAIEATPSIALNKNVPPTSTANSIQIKPIVSKPPKPTLLSESSSSGNAKQYSEGDGKKKEQMPKKEVTASRMIEQKKALINEKSELLKPSTASIETKNTKKSESTSIGTLRKGLSNTNPSNPQPTLVTKQNGNENSTNLGTNARLLTPSTISNRLKTENKIKEAKTKQKPSMKDIFSSSVVSEKNQNAQQVKSSQNKKKSELVVGREISTPPLKPSISNHIFNQSTLNSAPKLSENKVKVTQMASPNRSTKHSPSKKRKAETSKASSQKVDTNVLNAQNGQQHPFQRTPTQQEMSPQMQGMMYEQQLHRLNSLNPMLHSPQMVFGAAGAPPNPSLGVHGNNSHMSPLLMALQQQSSLNNTTPSSPGQQFSIGLSAHNNHLLKQQQEFFRKQQEEILIAQQKLLQQGFQQQQNPQQHLQSLLQQQQQHRHQEQLLQQHRLIQLQQQQNHQKQSQQNLDHRNMLHLEIQRQQQQVALQQHIQQQQQQLLAIRQQQQQNQQSQHQNQQQNQPSQQQNQQNQRL